MIKSIKGKKQLIASGLGGLTWEVLQALIGKDPDQSTVQNNFANGLAEVLTIIANGEMPRECLPAMVDNQVIAVGDKDRPISLSSTLRVG